jgi:hypothetical protein
MQNNKLCCRNKTSSRIHDYWESCVGAVSTLEFKHNQVIWWGHVGCMSFQGKTCVNVCSSKCYVEICSPIELVDWCHR